ncbi:mitochondrial Complex1_LYR family protein [Andalucia godoyi]|uniref:Mitochondrial Complex1_LYR family protein n=1 Tax=Andalucia godoyi TaxID=505711 RepID=A0A8K0AIT9_ANDGO|nr:mitochondrial Complex1_LYR family protein [Andalucia godoyi]|eukprot:ANDGO_05200.mRNA.1 mitochondrial Complex1_LYR family protein
MTSAHEIVLRKLTRILYKSLLETARQFPSFQTRAFLVHHIRTRFRDPTSSFTSEEDHEQSFDEDSESSSIPSHLALAHESIALLQNALGPPKDNPYMRYVQDVVDGIEVPSSLDDYDMSSPARKPRISQAADEENERKFAKFIYPQNCAFERFAENAKIEKMMESADKYKEAQTVWSAPGSNTQLLSEKLQTLEPVFRLIS